MNLKKKFSAVLKKKLLSIIRPPARSIFGIHDPIGLSYLTQLRVGLSKLNFHKFKNNFKDTIRQTIVVYFNYVSMAPG